MNSGLVKYNSYKNTTVFFQWRNCFSYARKIGDFFQTNLFQNSKKTVKEGHLISQDVRLGSTMLFLGISVQWEKGGGVKNVLHTFCL